MTIAESDWKKFKRLRTLALERFSQEVLDDCERIRGDESLTAHERYLEICRLLRDRDREIVEIFDDLRRSTAMVCLMVMGQRGLVTDQELSQFSADVQRAVRLE